MIVYYANVSGGKDSTAMCLWLKEQGIEYRAVHQWTGWEHPDTVAYLRDTLPDHIGPIKVHSREPDLDARREEYAAELEALLTWRSPFVRWVLRWGMFPSNVTRFCTKEIKVFAARDVYRAAHERGELPTAVVGIRAAESARRATLPERELSTTLDCMVWRPLLSWTEQDVIDIHRRHNVPPNPLYLRGSRRVGCWPCIHANKTDLRLIGEERIAVIERFEAIMEELKPDKTPRFFRAPSVLRDGGDGATIRRVIEWSKTARGGRELDRQATLPGFNDGCLRWGMCDSGAHNG